MKKNKKVVFSGVATALITPFSDGKIDFDALGRLIEFQISSGVDALLINGTTGENATLDEYEARDLISFASRVVDHRIPLIAGTGSNSTKKAISLSKYAMDVGCDAVLVVSPYYNKASKEGLVRHYFGIADSISIPVILYNIPSRTGVNISLDIYEILAKHENIVGVKEASASVSEIAKLAQICGDEFAIYSGNDDMLLPILSLGGAGVISVASNIIPRETCEICRLYFDGRADEATTKFLTVLPLINALFCEINPIPIKALMAKQGYCKEEFRLPLCPLDDKKRAELLKIARLYSL